MLPTVTLNRIPQMHHAELLTPSEHQVDTRRAVTIIGGGLAGLAAAVRLRQLEVPVVLHEAGSYPRHRVCGEFLSGVDDEFLVGLGLEKLLEKTPEHRQLMWWDGDEVLLQANLPEPARGVSRYALDAALARNVQQFGGQVLSSSRVDVDSYCRCSGVVLATGRPPQKSSPWVGIKAHYLNLPLLTDLEIHLSDYGYIGLTRVENGLVNVSGLFLRQQLSLGGGERSEILPTVLEGVGLKRLAQRLEKAQMVVQSFKTVSAFTLGWQRERANKAVCLGDTRALIPPFTGNGMSMALQSGVAAAPWLAQWSEGKGSWAAIQRSIARDQQRLFGRRLLWAKWLQQILLHPTLRQVSGRLLERGWISFPMLYRMLR